MSTGYRVCSIKNLQIKKYNFFLALLWMWVQSLPDCLYIKMKFLAQYSITILAFHNKQTNGDEVWMVLCYKLFFSCHKGFWMSNYYIVSPHIQKWFKHSPYTISSLSRSKQRENYKKLHTKWEEMFAVAAPFDSCSSLSLICSQGSLETYGR